MTSLPIPLFVAFLMVLLAASNQRQLNATPTGRIFAIVIYIYAASMVCIGFRWALDLVVLLPVAALLAVVCVALLYLAFRSLGRKGPVLRLSRDYWHLTPVLLIVTAIAFQPPWVEIILIGTNLVYAVLLICLARQGPASLQLVRLSGFRSAQQALWLVAALLIMNVLVDLIIAVDFMMYQGRHAARFVGIVNLIVLLFLGWGLVRAASGRAIDNDAVAETPVISDDRTDESLAEDNADDLDSLARLNRLLTEEGLYADSELNLMRLARKSGIPARTVSRIINTHTGQNMSQWVNTVRIKKACDLLEDGTVTVTQVMHDSGFLTKSNFNREFRRITGCSPSEWRARHC